MPYDIYSKDGADAAFTPVNGVVSGGTAADPLYDIRIRHDDTAGWVAEDPVLSLGEEGIDVDTGVRKVGDGVTAWSALAESGGGGGGGTSVHGDLTGRSVAGQHPISAITDLQAALDGKATTAQGAKADTAVQPAALDAYATDAELTAGLATKAATAHAHDDLYFTEAETTALLAGKQAAGSYAATVHAHATSDVTGLDAALTGKASTVHGHVIADTTGLQGALDGKADDLGADDNYVTDAEKVKLSNLSGTNTGDQTLPTWSTISGKPAVIAEGATQADARTAIGAGTSSFDGVYASLTSKPTLGTAAAAATGDFATAAQGVKADTAVQPTIADAKGDLIAATAADTLARVAVGSAGDSLTPDTAASPGVAWAVPLLKIASTASTSIAPALGDHGKYQRLTAATAVTITLPSDSSVAFPTGSYLLYKATAAGLATFVAGSGATLEDATPSAVMRAEGSLVQATKVASNTWTVDGDLA